MFAALSVVAVVVGRLLMPPAACTKASPPSTGAVTRWSAGYSPWTRRSSDGEGPLRVDDRSWRVTGPDTPAGARVRVARIEGTTLVVEAV